MQCLSLLGMGLPVALCLVRLLSMKLQSMVLLTTATMGLHRQTHMLAMITMMMMMGSIHGYHLKWSRIVARILHCHVVQIVAPVLAKCLFVLINAMALRSLRLQ